MYADGFVEYQEPSILRSFDADTPYVVQLERVFDGTVRVFYPDNILAAGVRLELRNDPRYSPQRPPDVAITDVRGEATFQFRYSMTQVHVAVPGFATMAVAAHRSTTEIHLTRGQRVTGRFETAEGAPLRASTISLTSPHSAPIGRVVRSNDDGTFDLGTLRPDEPVTLRVYPPERPPFKVEATPPANGEWSIEVPEARLLEGAIAGTPSDVEKALVFLTTPVSNSNKQGGGGIPSLMSDIRSSHYHRARTRLVPLRRARPDDSGYFSLEYVEDTKQTSYLLIHHPHLVNRIVPIPQTAAELPTISLAVGG